MTQRVIQLTPAEIQSGLHRQRLAELLILQLPANHDGRNSWLMDYGISPEAETLRKERGLTFDLGYMAATNKQQPLFASPASPGIEVIGKFKIHGLRTANGESKSMDTSKFHPTYEDAFAMAENYVNKDGKSIVIYEAIQVVATERPPVVSHPVI